MATGLPGTIAAATISMRISIDGAYPTVQYSVPIIGRRNAARRRETIRAHQLERGLKSFTTVETRSTHGKPE